MAILMRVALLVVFVSATASAQAIRSVDVAEPSLAPVVPSPTPTLAKRERVYEYGRPLVSTVTPTTLPVSSPAPPLAYEMLLVTDTKDSRVVHFNDATCVSLDSCMVGNVVNATWLKDLGSPSDNVVTFFSDRACGSPIITELAEPWTVDFRASGDSKFPRSFAVGMWFIHFDYPSHLVEPCAAGKA